MRGPFFLHLLPRPCLHQRETLCPPLWVTQGFRMHSDLGCWSFRTRMFVPPPPCRVLSDEAPSTSKNSQVGKSAAVRVTGKIPDTQNCQCKFSSVQSLSCVRPFATPWTGACQASMSITNSRSLLRLMSIESVMSSNHLILCGPLLLPPSIFPSIRVFPVSRLFTSGGQVIGASASASVFPVNIQD